MHIYINKNEGDFQFLFEKNDAKSDLYEKKLFLKKAN